LAVLDLAGCATWRPDWKHVENPDGPLDLVMALAGKAKPDVAPIETSSHVAGRIATERAVMYDGTVTVRGSVEKAGISGISTNNSHIDIIVLDAERRAAFVIATDFFPSAIPNNVRGIRGRSRFFVGLSQALPPGAVIQIVFQDGQARESDYYRGEYLSK
jgi:hypothetical protein